MHTFPNRGVTILNTRLIRTTAIVLLLGVLLIIVVLFGVLVPYGDARKNGTMFGLDVSNHQGQIDWPRIGNRFRFVYLKATEGDDFVDRQFESNLRSVVDKGIDVGAYHFFHFSYSGKDQAENFIRVVGDRISLPPVIDVEFGGNIRQTNIDAIRTNIRSMSDTLEKHYGVKPIIYVTAESYRQIVANHFENKIWLRSLLIPSLRRVPNQIMWQFSNAGLIVGIRTRVDLNVFIGTAEDYSSVLIKKKP